MFRDNMFGVVLLVFSGIVALILVWQIITGERIRYDGPAWLATILGVGMLAGIVYVLYDNYVRKSKSQWPNPDAGRESLVDKVRGRFKRDDRQDGGS